MQADLIKARNYLLKLLKKTAPEKEYLWVDSKIKGLTENFDPKSLYLSFGLIHRNVTKSIINLSNEDLYEAEHLRRGFNPTGFTTDQLTRILFLLAIPADSAETYLNILLTIYDTADVGELTAIYSAFPLLPFPQEIEFKCAEGVRTNMTVVFERIALHNPYTTEYLNEESWNQMVIKTIFVGKNINEIYGLDNRRNYKLSRIARDLAHERWAAGRLVRPELWRLLVPFVDEPVKEDIKKLWNSTLPYEQEAGMLLALESNNELAEDEEFAPIKELVKTEGLTWEILAEKYPFSVW